MAEMLNASSIARRKIVKQSWKSIDKSFQLILLHGPISDRWPLNTLILLAQTVKHDTPIANPMYITWPQESRRRFQTCQF